MWRSRWRCVIKPAYSVSFLLPINIFLWQNVLYFPKTFILFRVPLVCLWGWAGVELSVWRLVTGEVWGSKPGGIDTFRARPDAALYKTVTGSLSREVKRPRHGHNHPFSSSAEVKEKVQLHLWDFMACYRANDWKKASYRTANRQMLHFIYLFNKYTYWIF